MEEKKKNKISKLKLYYSFSLCTVSPSVRTGAAGRNTVGNVVFIEIERDKYILLCNLPDCFMNVKEWDFVEKKKCV